MVSRSARQAAAAAHRRLHVAVFEVAVRLVEGGGLARTHRRGAALGVILRPLIAPDEVIHRRAILIAACEALPPIGGVIGSRLTCLTPLQVERGPLGRRAIVVLVRPLHGDGVADAVARLGTI